jgi:DNA (cytosine-5)-methyltransferase 1
MKELTHIDLFSGIGGFALSARWAGIKTVQFVEIDPFCQKVLQKNFKGVPIWDDIKTFTVDTYTEGARQLRTAQHENDGEDSNRGRGFDPTDIHKDIAHDIKTFTNANWNGLQEQRAEQQTGGNRQLYETSSNSEGGKPREQTESEGWKNIGGGNSEGRPFLLTGGFPCQPFSCAGKRRGKEDDRYLWEEMLRVIKEFKPTWIIGENVNGIRSMEFQDGVSELEGDTIIQEDGNGDYTNVLDGICDSLEAIGYEVQPVIIPACAVNAPHRRDRVWIVAHSTNSRVEGLRQERENPVFQNTGIISEGSGNTETEERGNGQSILAENVSRRPISNRGFGGIIAPDTEPEGLQGHFQQQTKQTGAYCRCLADCHAPDTEHNQAARHGQDGGRVLPITESEGLNNGNQWEQDWYSVALRTCVRGVDDGVSRGVDRTNRLKSLGNSVVPMIPFLLMKAILEVENDQS